MPKILIDAGHYSRYNRSPAYQAYYEGDQMWKLSQYLTTALKEYGFTVGSTKTTINGYPKSSGKDDVYARGQMAKGYDLMLSLHSNACGTEAVDRAVIIHPMSGKSAELAKKLGSCVKSTMGVSSYQIAQRDYNTGAFYYDGKAHNGKDYYGVIRGAVAQGVPCIIIEHGFHTNTAVAKWLMPDVNLKKLAEAEAKALAEHFGVKKQTATASTYSTAEIEAAKNTVKTKAGLADKTIDYLMKYQYGNDLITKLAKAMK